jgi:hypothetical protein
LQMSRLTFELVQRCESSSMFSASAFEKDYSVLTQQAHGAHSWMAKYRAHFLGGRIADLRLTCLRLRTRPAPTRKGIRWYFMIKPSCGFQGSSTHP